MFWDVIQTDNEDDENFEAPYHHGAIFNAVHLNSSFPVLPDGSGRTDNHITTQSLPSDPYISNQWYLDGGWGTHASSVWNDYTGAGINIGILDDGHDLLHAELNANYSSTSSHHYDINDGTHNVTFGPGDYHGTNVAGVIGAQANGSGTVGVAYEAILHGYQIDFSQGISPSMLANLLNNYVTPNVDVMNNSWGFTSSFAGNFNAGWGSLENALVNTVSNGRGGLGANIVFSAGNNRADGDDVNHSNLNNSPYTIAVAAHDQDGTVSSFSNPGAALLVSAPGTNMLTTDNTGSAGISSGDFVTTQGTSYSAPAVSAVIGLMLDANADLGYRDVQEILAYSSRHINSGGSDWQFNGASNLNGGGLHFSHDFGFGAVNAHSAVRLAETWDYQQTYDGSLSGSEGLSTLTANGGTFNLSDGQTVSDFISVAGDIELEQVIVNVDISHNHSGDLTVVLVSPDGTESYLLTRPNTFGSNGSGTDNPGSYSGSINSWDLSTNAHWGESSQGQWELRITDASGNGTGSVTWNVEFMGNAQRANDQYIYTNEFSSRSGGTVLSDSDGGIDTINAAAVTGHNTINLGGGTSTIDGKNLTIDSSIENISAGDGADILTGSASNNVIFAGRGADTIYGTLGDDTIDGFQGTDTVDYSFDLSEFLVDIIDTSTVMLNHVANAFTDTLSNIENFVFNGLSLTRIELEAATQAISDIAIRAIYNGGADVYSYISDSIVSTTITASDIEGSSFTGDYFTANRTDQQDLTLTIHSSQGPADLRLWASDLGGTIMVNGVAGPNITFFGQNAADNVTISLSGNDRLYGRGGDDILAGGAGLDRLYGDEGNDQLNGGVGNDFLNGGSGADTINGDGGNDSIYGEVGNDLINGGAGDDLIRGQGGADEIFGNSGNDRIYGGDNHDTIRGGIDNDVLYGDAGEDQIFGDGGVDLLYGGMGNDTINGGNGDDSLYGHAGEDIIYGGDGSDVMNGGAQADTLYGGNGADRLIGGSGSDELDGGSNNDRLDGNDGTDTLYGRDGDDQLYGHNGNDIINGGAGSDQVFGGTDDDTISGGAGDDVLYSQDGNDAIFGNDGNDTLYGGNGSDLLDGGLGLDIYFGGSGPDRFNISQTDINIDQIRDFDNTGPDSDILDISDILTGYTVGADISAFVELRFWHSNRSDIRVNADGIGTDFETVGILWGADFTGQNAQDMVMNGTLSLT